MTPFFDGPGLVVLVVDFCILLAVTWWPLRRHEKSDDQGDGVSEVRMPRRPVPVKPIRAAAFLLAGMALVTVYISLRWPSLDVLYSRSVGALANLVTQEPTAVGGYLPRLSAGVIYIFAAACIALACTLRATPGRRLVVALHGLLFAALCCVTDSLIVVLGIGTGWPIAPYGLEGGMLHVILAFLVFVRLIFTTFSLPMPSRLTATRPPYGRDTYLWWVSLTTGLCALAIGWALVSRQWRFSSDVATIATFILLSAWSPLAYGVLILLKAFRTASPATLRRPPPINVIVAAFNERELIKPCLESIDAAATRYAGDVHVIVANDGSTDDTVEVCQATFAAFRHASGEVVHRENGGIARAYNSALAACTRDIIIRVDGDVVVHPDSFRYSVPWLLEDERVGQVAGMSLPRPRQRTVFAVMRGFECLLGFGFARCAETEVDCVLNVQGPFACMRRAVLEEVAGWTSGMNGEDLDMTMKVTRRGYRVVHDLRVVTYEDVPPTVREFREQRNRWSRAGAHNYARFAAFCAGNTGPRSWYQFTRLFSSRLFAVFSPILLVYGIEMAVVAPSLRRTVLIFAVVYALRWIMSLIQFSVLSTMWGVKRYMLLFPLWYPFLLFRHFLILEGLLSLPTRAVRVGTLLSRQASDPRPSRRERKAWRPAPFTPALAMSAAKQRAGRPPRHSRHRAPSSRPSPEPLT